MSGSKNPTSFIFGVEIELLVKPKNTPEMSKGLANCGWDKTGTQSTKSKNRRALHTALARILSDENVPTSLATEDYTAWTVADEPSLDEITGYWRLELVSRAMSTDDLWQDEIDTVFSTMDEHCEIALTQGCSMHVHISPGLRGQELFSMDNLKGILKGMAYYDEAITRMMPADRKKSPWAMSNVQGKEAPSVLKNAYTLVPTSSWAPLFQVFDKINQKAVILLTFNGNRHFSWNFSHVTSACGTVEFRRPPGVRTATEAKHWATFTMGFVSQAMASNWNEVKTSKVYPSVNQAASFIRSGLSKLVLRRKGTLLPNMMKEDLSSPVVYSTSELEIIKQKKANKAKQESPFVEKANSRPNTPRSRSSTPGRSVR